MSADDTVLKAEITHWRTIHNTNVAAYNNAVVSLTKGELLDFEKAAQILGDRETAVRSKLLALPASVSGLLLGHKPGEIENLLRQEIEESSEN
jgi:hypothetical protein